ncbi:MAG: hypothetical protein QM627_12690 [Luteolibacter sp.]
MKLVWTRIVIFMGCLVFLTVPMFLLAKLSDDIRNFQFVEVFGKNHTDFPQLSLVLWRLGPIAWWSYFIPLLVSLGIALRMPVALSGARLFLSAIFLIVQPVLVLGAFLPYGRLYEVMGHPVEENPDAGAMCLNVLMLIGALFFCGASLMRGRRAESF